VDNLTEEKAVNMCNASERSKAQAKKIRKEAEDQPGVSSVDAVIRGRSQGSQPSRSKGCGEARATYQPKMRSKDENSASQNGDEHHQSYNKDEHRQSESASAVKYGEKRLEFICIKCDTAHKKFKCPAYGHTCTKCQRKHHFESMCRLRVTSEVRICDPSKKSPETADKSNSVAKAIGTVKQCFTDNAAGKSNNNLLDDESNLSNILVTNDNSLDGILVMDAIESKVHSLKKNSKEWLECIKINGQDVVVKLDTGSGVNTLSRDVLLGIGIEVDQLKPTMFLLEAYLGQQVKPLGTIELQCAKSDAKGNTVMLQFMIVEEKRRCLLGLEGCEALGLVKRVCNVDVVNVTKCKEDFIQQNVDVFSGPR